MSVNEIFDLLTIFDSYPPLMNIIFSMNFYMMILLILFMLYKRIKMMGAVRTLVLFNDGSQDINNYLIKEGKLQIRPKGLLFGKDNIWTPKVSSEHIISHRRSFRKAITNLNPIGRMPQRDLIIAVEGSPECVNIKTVDVDALARDENIIPSKLLKIWSVEEIKDLIKKSLAQAMAQRKLFNDQQFYIFCALQVMIVFLLFMVAQRMGIYRKYRKGQNG